MTPPSIPAETRSTVDGSGSFSWAVPVPSPFIGICCLGILVFDGGLFSVAGSGSETVCILIFAFAFSLMISWPSTSTSASSSSDTSTPLPLEYIQPDSN